MADGPERGDKLRIFISYSRDDMEFADQLEATLRLAGYLPTIDREISGGEDWERRLSELIGDSDTVVVVLSPSWVNSASCAWEAREAQRLGKRIIPVACKPLGATDQPPAMLAALNYIFFYKEPRKSGTGFAPGLMDLVNALNTDLDWLREHTRYLRRATEWEAGGRATNRLLSGPDVTEAKAWLDKRPKDAPEPTSLHRDFILASEHEAISRASAERQRLEQMTAAVEAADAALKEKQAAQAREAEASKRVVRRTLIGLVVALVLAAAATTAGVFAFQQKQDADRQRDVALAQTQKAEAAESQLLEEYLGLLAETKVSEIVSSTGTAAGEIALDEMGEMFSLMEVGEKTFATAGQFGAGRVVAVGHDEVLDPTTQEIGVTADMADVRLRFVGRLLKLLKGSAEDPQFAFTVGHCEFLQPSNWMLPKQLEDEGNRVKYISGAIDAAQLGDVNVLVIGNAQGDFSEGEVAAIQDFVSNGGGLLAAGLGYDWQGYAVTDKERGCKDHVAAQDKADMATYPMNRLVKPYGIRWTEQALDLKAAAKN